MALISSLQKDSITLLNTYKSRSGKNIVHVLQSQVGTLPPKKRLVCCDASGMPYKLKDFQKKGVDVYERAQDGTTILKSADGRTQKLSQFFNVICEKLT